jgi:hypothetical protein
MLIFGPLAMAIAGCAADRAAEPAKLIGGEVAKFHALLSQFQDDTTAWEDYSASRIVGSDLRAAAADATSKRLETEWSLREAKSDSEIFKALRDQATIEVKAETTPMAVPTTTRTELPLDELSAVAGSLDKLSEPSGFFDDATVLLEFGKAVNDQLKKIEADAAKKANSGS